MQIDLAELREMHPRLPEDLALLIVARAALGLQRHGHQSPVMIGLDLEGAVASGLLAWPVSDPASLDQHDQHRMTEDGAEAISLALAHRYRGWRVVRRMQREERADWLLEQVSEGPRQIIALEVSGVDRGSIAARLSEKLDQVAHSVDVDQRWAGVIGFERPVAALHSTKAAQS